MVTRRIFAAAWLVAAALLLLLVPCTRSGHAGWFLVWQTGSVEIVLNQIRSEKLLLALAGAATCATIPALHLLAKRLTHEIQFSTVDQIRIRPARPVSPAFQYPSRCLEDWYRASDCAPIHTRQFGQAAKARRHGARLGCVIGQRQHHVETRAALGELLPHRHV
ncbi:MAG TPA: hypothetical protein VME68_15390 [Acidobacteriaceae bacterium]|nr:hypothetical protein [Acidobacteriaceae bacterium]